MAQYPRMMRRSIGSQLEWREFATAESIEPGWSDDELDRMQQGKVSDWPACRYPPEGGPAAGKVFKSEADVPEGWLDHPTGADPIIAPKPKAPASASEAQARLAKAEAENATLKESLAFLQADLDAARNELSALRRVVETSQEIHDAQARFQADGQGEVEKPTPAPKRKAKA